MELFDYQLDYEGWKKEFLRPEAMMDASDPFYTELETNVYLLPLFNMNFCSEAIRVAEADGNWTTQRHESYPTTDMELNSFGLHDIYEKVFKEHVYPKLNVLYELWETTEYAAEYFLAKYEPDGQTHLELHNDGSDLTVNLMLTQPGVDFVGGGVHFPRQELLVNPEIGHAVVHPGAFGFKHGSLPVTSGKRYIIVSFLKAYSN